MSPEPDFPAWCRTNRPCLTGVPAFQAADSAMMRSSLQRAADEAEHGGDASTAAFLRELADRFD